MSVRIRPIQRAKRILRRQLKQLLKVIPDEEKQNQSQRIHENLYNLQEFKDSNRISCYISTDLEVSTGPIIRYIINSKKQCFVPRYTIGKKMQMVLLESVEDYETLSTSKFHGVKQPKYSDIREEALDDGGLDMIIVHGLAYTLTGKRLGYGGGYYDTYIKRIWKSQSHRPTVVGLAFKEQIFPYLPTHIHDVNINLVLTP